jgi:integrase
MHYVFNKLAALTGMRHGELLGLRGEFVFDTELKVRARFNRFINDVSVLTKIRVGTLRKYSRLVYEQ